MGTQAIVGRFDADAHHYSARLVRTDGYPSWTLNQIRATWARTCERDTARLCDVLLDQEWALLTHTCPAGPGQTANDAHLFVPGVGRAYRDREPFVWKGSMPGGDPGHVEWAYLWEAAHGALHVYTAVTRRWHHIATLPAEQFEVLTPATVLDIESRRRWIVDAQDAADGAAA
jgi:hypothetical protein